MSIRQQAAALGLSPAQVHKLRGRGMPADIDGARSWRKANVSALRGKTATQLPEMRTDLSAIKQRAKGELPESLAEAECIYRDLEAATQTASKRAAQLTGSTQPAIDELGRRWSLLTADLLKRKLEVAERIQALRVQSGELMLASEAKEVFGSFLQDLRRYAEAMPASMAFRCNPTDPALAETALRDWLNDYFRKLHQDPAGIGAEELKASKGISLDTEKPGFERHLDLPSESRKKFSAKIP